MVRPLALSSPPITAIAPPATLVDPLIVRPCAETLLDDDTTSAPPLPFEKPFSSVSPTNASCAPPSTNSAADRPPASMTEPISPSRTRLPPSTVRGTPPSSKVTLAARITVTASAAAALEICVLLAAESMRIFRSSAVELTSTGDGRDGGGDAGIGEWGGGTGTGCDWPGNSGGGGIGKSAASGIKGGGGFGMGRDGGGGEGAGTTTASSTGS
eukprot:4431944-Prymnesium_polylepis.1